MRGTVVEPARFLQHRHLKPAWLPLHHPRLLKRKEFSSFLFIIYDYLLSGDAGVWGVSGVAGVSGAGFGISSAIAAANSRFFNLAFVPLAVLK